MICVECPKFNKKDMFCIANLFADEYTDNCLLKMLIQEMRLSNQEEDEGEWWKQLEE